MLQQHLSIRLATSEDAEAIALQAEQLGYSVSQQAVQERLKHLDVNSNHALYVADISNNLIVGWIHVYARESLLAGRVAEIGGLIVDQNHRGQGVGRLLLQQAEQWAHKQDCRRMIVRSNTVREAAHHFYKRVGYQSFKTQLVFDKSLNNVSGEPHQSLNSFRI